ncbi:hypothetical protein AUR65_008530 [Haloferax marisrubri]|uniref:CopG family transcriptional regulator n=2 Tax=Haloferax marisrubri TaxID=1544719 RepID=A0A2P4NQN6_9EURY|nr:hypothetical protein AUR65_008530 [Haloferax marisrubri]
MVSDPVDNDRADDILSSFEAWLDQRVRETGKSREQVFEELLASHWQLNEIAELVGRDRRTSNEIPSEAEGETPPPRDDTEANKPVSDDELTEVLELIEGLQTKVETEAQRRARLEQSVQALTTRLDELEAALDEVEDLPDELDAVESTLRERHRTLDARFDDEFENLQTILEHLVETDDRVETKLKEIETQYGAEIREIRAEREQLRRVKQAAKEADTHEGDCEHCGETIDLTLLTSPECPNCQRPLHGVEKETKWLVLTDYTVTVASSDGGTRRGGEATGRPERASGRDAASDRDTARDSADTDGQPPESKRGAPGTSDRSMSQSRAAVNEIIDSFDSVSAGDDGATDAGGETPDATGAIDPETAIDTGESSFEWNEQNEHDDTR